MNQHPRGRVPHLALLLLFLAWVPACRPPRPDASGRPNVLFVSIDTLRADHVSAYGYHRETSPHLDAFADEAVLFENAYAHWPSTLQSHMSMFTSLFPQVHGVDKGKGLSTAVPLLAEVLRQAGYRTAGYYSLGWLHPKFGFSRGFERYRFKESGEEVRDAALAIMRKSADKSWGPFFVFFHIREVHCGPGLEKQGNALYTSPSEYRDTFLPYPEVEVTHLPMDIWKDRVELTEKELANVVAQYDGGILHADAILRDTFEAMKDHGVFDDTLIVVTSDHGESIGDRKTFGHGGVWEEGLRVPLIVKLPESLPESERWRGVRLGYRVQAVDLAPTILRFAGLPIPAWYQGRDLFEAAERDVVAEDTRAIVLIRDGYKLKMMKARRRMALYDLDEDPGEAVSIVHRRQDLAQSMGEALEAHVRSSRDLAQRLAGTEVPVELDEEQLKRLKSLGYVN